MEVDQSQSTQESRQQTGATESSAAESKRPSPDERVFSDTVKVIPVTNKAEKKRWMNVPWNIPGNTEHKNWVPPLKMMVEDYIDTKKNPFFKRAEIQLFIATQNGSDVGRIAAVENQGHNEFHDENIGFYGFFESIEDQTVANALFEMAESWCRNRGLTKMMGPMNPSTNHETGLLVRGQSQHPTIQTTWNPKYYQTLHENAGLQDEKDLVAYWLPTNMKDKFPESIARAADRVRKNSNIKIRSFDLKNFDRDIEICFEVYNNAWEKNWGFFPMTKEEFLHSAKEMKMLVDNRFCFIAEVDGKPAGFCLTLPDYNWIFKSIRNGSLLPFGWLKLLLGKRFLKTVRVVALGVKPEYRNGGIFALFNQECWNRAVAHNVVGGEASWILDDNEAMKKPWEAMGAPLYRRWRIFSRQLK